MKIAKILAFTLVIMTVGFNVALASVSNYEKEAKGLNDMGLYRGVSTTDFDPDLTSKLSREQGVVLLLRIFGKENEAENFSDEDKVFAKFSDAATVSDWAKKQVAYAIDKGLVKGVSEDEIGPQQALTGKAYATLILRELGYVDADYNQSLNILANVGGLTYAEATRLADKELIRDDAVGISYSALSAKKTNSEPLILDLINKGVVTRESALKAGLKLPAEQQPELPEIEEEDDEEQPKEVNRGTTLGYVGLITRVREVRNDEVEITILHKTGKHTFLVAEKDRDDVNAEALNSDIGAISLDKEDDLKYFVGLYVECSVEDGYMVDDTISFNNNLHTAKFYELTNKNAVKILTTGDDTEKIDAYKNMMIIEAKLTVDGDVLEIKDAELSKLSAIDEVDEDIDDFSDAHSDKATTIYYYLVEVDDEGNFHDIDGDDIDVDDAADGNEAAIAAIIFDPDEVFNIGD